MDSSEVKYDPVFKAMGLEIISNDSIRDLRTHNITLSKGAGIKHFLPQEGFQEEVCMNDADVLIIGGRRGAGKAQPLYSKILTPFGFKTIGDLIEGDLITDPISGMYQYVAHIFEHTNKKTIRLTFEDGSKVDCCEEHLWAIQRGEAKASWDVCTTSFIYSLRNSHYSSQDVYVPLNNPITFECRGQSMASPTISPYAVGAFFAIGMRKEKLVAFASKEDEELFREMRCLKVSLGKEIKGSIPIVKCDLSEFLDIWGIDMGGKDTLYIPRPYKFGSIDERIKFLQGFFDACAKFDELAGFYFTSKSNNIIKDIRFMIKSVGGKLIEKHVGNETRYYISAKCPSLFFRRNSLIKKAKRISFAWDKRLKIVSLEYIGQQDMRCIKVSAGHSLYATDDLVITHNTYAITLAPMRYINHPNFVGIGYRKQYDDIKDGPWKESKKLYSTIATPKESSFEWVFKSGANIHYDQLQNEAEVDERVRGMEYPFILIDEVPQISHKTFFTLLASNRNSLGLKNQFIGTCNPQRRKHWLYRFIQWYIDEKTGEIRADRQGRKRYFFKYGQDIENIIWGDTKQEVYDKAKDKIDVLITDEVKLAGLDWRSMIASLSFIEGKYEENTLFIKNDPAYYGRLAQQGGLQAMLDMRGIWGGAETGDADITAEEFEKIFSNSEQISGEKSLVLDVALENDDCTFGVFDGNHLIDIEVFRKVGSVDIVNHAYNLLQKWGIKESMFAFDSQGVGQFLKQPFNSDKKNGAIAFSGNSASTDRGVYRNLKSECIDRPIRGIREGKRSVSTYAAKKKLLDGRTLEEHLCDQRAVLIRKIDSNKIQYISKPEMRLLLGRKSPDELDMLIMHEVFALYRKKTISKKSPGLGS